MVKLTYSIKLENFNEKFGDFKEDICVIPLSVHHSNNQSSHLLELSLRATICATATIPSIKYSELVSQNERKQLVKIPNTEDFETVSIYSINHTTRQFNEPQ